MNKPSSIDGKLLQENMIWLNSNNFECKISERKDAVLGVKYKWYNKHSESLSFNLYLKGDVMGSLNVNYYFHNEAITNMLEEFQNTALMAKNYGSKKKRLEEKIVRYIKKSLEKQEIKPDIVGVDVMENDELSYLIKIPGKKAGEIYPQLLKVKEFLCRG